MIEIRRGGGQGVVGGVLPSQVQVGSTRFLGPGEGTPFPGPGGAEVPSPRSRLGARGYLFTGPGGGRWYPCQV